MAPIAAARFRRAPSSASNCGSEQISCSTGAAAFRQSKLAVSAVTDVAGITRTTKTRMNQSRRFTVFSPRKGAPPSE